MPRDPTARSRTQDWSVNTSPRVHSNEQVASAFHFRETGLSDQTTTRADEQSLKHSMNMSDGFALSLSNMLDLSSQQPAIGSRWLGSTGNGYNPFPSHYGFTPDMIREACMMYMNQTQILGSQPGENSVEGNANFVSNLASVAVTLLATLSGLESSIYGLVCLFIIKSIAC